MAASFHAEMMAALDRQVKSASYTVPPSHYYAMRKALRRAQMRGYPLRNEHELMEATARELGR